MIALFKKELRYFFLGWVGYTVMSLFVVSQGLFLCILPTDFNILEAGYASLYLFFTFCSWVFLLLIPALTMRSFSEEKRIGMLPLLLTRPLSFWQIILGKYLAVLAFVVILLLPSIAFYVYMLENLSTTELDYATIVGSALALLLLSMALSALGLWASSVTENQMLAFIIATFLGVFLFYGVDAFLGLFIKDSLMMVGFKAHFDDISRGVIDSRNVLYFICITVFFLSFAFIRLKSEKYD